MKFIVDTVCSTGAYRDNNEDILVWGEDPKQNFFWMLVGDGMGGHNAGDVASKMLAEVFEKAIQDLEGYYELHWPNWIERTFQAANLSIWQSSQNNQEYKGMGTTGVFIAYRAGQYHIGWVGDSRVYQLTKGRLNQLTRDHSAIHYLLDKGSITQEEADNASETHLLARALGSSKQVVVDTVSGSWSKDDVLTLTSDGLHDFVDEKLFVKALSSFAKGKTVGQSLVTAAIDGGSQDNITIGLIRITDK